MRTLLNAVCLSVSFLAVQAQESLVGAGRAIPPGFVYEVYGGLGSMDSLEGGVQERRGNDILSGGLTADLDELGLGDDTSTLFLGAQAYNKWVTFLVDYRSTSLDASGTADQDIRLDVDSVSFRGLNLDYLLIPANTDYDIEADATMLGLGLRVTPFTFFPEGRVRFTPWFHLGLQLISTDYDIDAGATVSLDAVGFPDRIYAEQGQASGSEEAGIPEYGIGGEVRILLGDKGAEIVGQATYKLLDFQGAIDSLGVDRDEFEDIDFDYTALEANIFLVYPLNDSVDLLAGVYIEQVDIDATLESDDSFGEFDRDADISYTIYGIRAGFRF